jgi:hypothetical protein
LIHIVAKNCKIDRIQQQISNKIRLQISLYHLYVTNLTLPLHIEDGKLVVVIDEFSAHYVDDPAHILHNITSSFVQQNR